MESIKNNTNISNYDRFLNQNLKQHTAHIVHNH